MAHKRRTMGSGAVISVLLKMVYPSKHIRDKFPNIPDKQRLEGAAILRKEIKSINCQEQEAIVFRHDDFTDVELYATQRFCRIIEEGSPPDYFINDDEIEEQLDQRNANNESEKTDLSDAVAQFITASAGIQQSFNTDEVELI